MYCAVRYRVETEEKQVGGGVVVIITVLGELPDKSACLKEFINTVDTTLEKTGLIGVVVDLRNCSWVGEAGFGVIARLIKDHRTAFQLSNAERNQPRQKFNILKLQTITKLCDTEEQAIGAVISTTEK